MMLLRPWWLIVLPLILLALAMRRRKAGGWEGIVLPPVMARMRALGMVADGGSRWMGLLPFAAAGVLAVALSGPARMVAGGGALVRADPMILLIDMSPSVAGGARLADAQAAAAQMLALSTRPVGVALYAADSFLASAPTTDAASLQGLVAVLGPDTMPVAGSRPDIALGALHTLFGPMDRADVVMISDGGGIGPRAEQEARRLTEAGARLWALPLTDAGPEGAPAPNPDALAALARAGGGESLADARALAARIERGHTARLAASTDAPLIFRDLGPWLLPLVMALLLPLLRRRV